MRTGKWFAGAALVLALAGCGKKDEATAPTAAATPATPVAAASGQDWTTTVTATPEGGYRIGNPDAPVKLVEYASFTCPHCRAFEMAAADALQQKYVATGKLSWEFRSFLIHGPDVAVSLLMDCRGAAPFFQLSQQLYADQDTWLQKLVDLPAAEQQRLQGLSPTEQFKALADAAGLYGFFAARGLPRPQAEACLGDAKAVDRLTANQERAVTAEKVDATPTFFVNGEKQADVFDWATLEPKLKAAGA